jgi:hypothetical protein
MIFSVVLTESRHRHLCDKIIRPYEGLIAWTLLARYQEELHLVFINESSSCFGRGASLAWGMLSILNAEGVLGKSK